jgi:uncharacterized protein YegL
MHTFDDIDFNISFGNFNPADIQVDETINAVFVVDVSPSVGAYVHELNYAFNDFVQHIQQSHVADQLMVSVVEFSEKVKVRSGFQPIGQLSRIDFKPCGQGTALYDAVSKGLQMAKDYRKNLEISGVLAKTLLFVITDGEDNSSGLRPEAIKKEISTMMAQEQNMFSFKSILFGVGDAGRFENARQQMGIELLAKVGTNGEEIRKMLGIISQSVNSAARNQAIQF